MEAHPAAGWGLSLHILAGEQGSMCDPRENGEGVVTIHRSLISTVANRLPLSGSDCFCVPFQKLGTLHVLRTPRVPVKWQVACSQQPYQVDRWGVLVPLSQRRNPGPESELLNDTHPDSSRYVPWNRRLWGEVTCRG